MIALAPDIWRATIEQFQACGTGRRECVVYWVGPAGDPSFVDEVVHPVHAASRIHFTVDNSWLNSFWLTLADRSRSVRVQVHTHGGRAFHSASDDAWPLLRHEGFLSLVVPGFARNPRPASSDLYLARINRGFEWEGVEPAAFLQGLP